MSILRREVARVFKPLLAPARFKGAKGGRGSGKSHNFAGDIVSRAIAQRGLRWLCGREIQKSLKDSARLLIVDKINEYGANHLFGVREDKIITPGGGIIAFVGLQDHTADSLKSYEGFDGAWVEEAHSLSAKSKEKLEPTIRKEGSEIWYSWNPRDETDPVDEFFASKPENSICVHANYTDNPWFPEALEAQRKSDLKNYPLRYGHVWLGEYEPSIIDSIWDYRTLSARRVSEAPEMQEIYVSVDHAVKTETQPKANEHGIIVGGRGVDGRGYVLDDLSMKGKPEEWGRKVISAYDMYGADGIIVETNQGGELVRRNLEAIRPHLPIYEVTATRGKHVRATPIASLYNMGRIVHVGSFPRLEWQMVKMTSGGWEGPKDQSPDRCDALVWLFTKIFPQIGRKEEPDLEIFQPVANGWMG